MKIVAWHPLLTDHQAYTYGAVVPLVDSFRVNVWRTSDAVREAHGWKRLSPILRDEQIVPARGWWLWSREVIDQEKDAWHLFGSPFEDRRQIIVMIMAVMMGRKVGVSFTSGRSVTKLTAQCWASGLKSSLPYRDLPANNFGRWVCLQGGSPHSVILCQARALQ